MYEGETIKFLNTEEREALFRTIENDTSRHHIRNKAIFLLAEYAAQRVSEVGLLKVSDFNRYTREVYFRRLKGSRNNTLRILDDTVYTALIDYLDYRKENGIDSECLFPSQKGTPISRQRLNEIIKHYCDLTGIAPDKAHFHTLKHTRAVTLAEIGLDTKEVQFWLGHKRIQNTEIYLQFTSKQQDILYQKFIALTNEQAERKIYQHE